MNIVEWHKTWAGFQLPGYDSVDISVYPTGPADVSGFPEQKPQNYYKKKS
jgi:hypothetical protein